MSGTNTASSLLVHRRYANQLMNKKNHIVVEHANNGYRILDGEPMTMIQPTT